MSFISKLLKRNEPYPDIQFIKTKELAITPTKTNELDAGYDLHSLKDFCITPGSSKLIYTGIQVIFPKGYCGIIHGRSGLAGRHSILTHTGVIDYGYEGEIGVILFNLSKQNYTILKGDRIGQLVISKIFPPPETCAHCEYFQVDCAFSFYHLLPCIFTR